MAEGADESLFSVDLIVRRARLEGGAEPVDIGIVGDRIVEVAPRLEVRAPKSSMSTAAS